MTLQQKINAFEKLGFVFREACAGGGRNLSAGAELLSGVAETAIHYNGWFTRDNVENAFRAWAGALSRNNIERWLLPYEIKPAIPKRIGVITAGNIPLAGLHDLLCVLISGNSVILKVSANDGRLIKAVAEVFHLIEPLLADRINFTEGPLKDPDAVIATGGNNSARYFDYYFGKYPHVIRKNRNSVAVLRGNESADDLIHLGDDVFRYFGLGCRSVSKLYVPEGYEFDLFFNAVFGYSAVLNHARYYNNYEYNKVIYLMQGVELLENGFLLLKRDTGFSSPVAVLYYEFYKDIDVLNEQLKGEHQRLQCIVSGSEEIKNRVDFGQTQFPQLWDYADGADTLAFLLSL